MLNRENYTELAPGISQYWLMDHQIVVFEATQSTRVVVDAWVNTVMDVMKNWPKDCPYLALHDFRGKNIAFTPYARKRAQELVPLSSPVPGYAAVIVPGSFVAQIIMLFMRTQKAGNINNQLFFSYDEGLRWLESKLGYTAPVAPVAARPRR